ncbi:hypothetical protein [Streptomyces sp. NPDC052127]|uniref:hypothetical protein n=1 Tax=Streptomyces sp. NPDC052127 TaxID=3155679 RepID=UPI00342A1121
MPLAGPLRRSTPNASEPLLSSFRATFHAEYGPEIAELEEGMGLYRQMTKLSERQFDVLILRDVSASTPRRPP